MYSIALIFDRDSSTLFVNREENCLLYYEVRVLYSAGARAALAKVSHRPLRLNDDARDAPLRIGRPRRREEAHEEQRDRPDAGTRRCLYGNVTPQFSYNASNACKII